MVIRPLLNEIGRDSTLRFYVEARSKLPGDQILTQEKIAFVKLVEIREEAEAPRVRQFGGIVFCVRSLADTDV